LSEPHTPQGAWIAQRSRPLLAFYVLLLAVALFSPTSDVQSALVDDVVRVLQMVLPDAWVTFTWVEVLMNVVIIAPLVFLCSMVWPRLSWQQWAAYGFLGAIAVELLQGLLLPDRSASFSDIVANGTGATIGAVVGSWLVPTPETESPR
jgi:hypothetical protein